MCQLSFRIRFFNYLNWNFKVKFKKIENSLGYVLENGSCIGGAQDQCTCENGLAGDGCENGEELCIRCFSGIALLIIL